MYRYEDDRVARKIPVRIVEEKTASAHSAQPPGQVGTVREPALPAGDEVASRAGDELDWQVLTLRLQADMDNFRKRQVRRADEAIATERERLLRLILPVADNLDRALRHDSLGDKTLRQGVELTYRELMRLLEVEGVTRIEAVGQSFNPEWHEAMTTVPADAEAGTIVDELEGGYKLGSKLLRPARVVVAA